MKQSIVRSIDECYVGALFRFEAGYITLVSKRLFSDAGWYIVVISDDGYTLGNIGCGIDGKGDNMEIMLLSRRIGEMKLHILGLVGSARYFLLLVVALFTLLF